MSFRAPRFALLAGAALTCALAGATAARADTLREALELAYRTNPLLQAARALDRQSATSTQARDAAARAAALMRQRRQAGLASQLDVLNTDRPLAQLDQQLATLHARRRDAAVDLDIALGGGLSTAILPDPNAHASNDKAATP